MSQHARNNPDLPPVFSIFDEDRPRKYQEPVFVPDTPEEKRLRAMLRKRDDELREARALLNECCPKLDYALSMSTHPSLNFRIGYFLAKTEKP